MEKHADSIPPLTPKYYEKRIRISPDLKSNEWRCEIRIDYAGSGDPIIWSTHSRKERRINVRLKEDNGTLISVNDCISDYYIPTDRVGMTFADDMIPFVLKDYSGTVELKYNNDALYSKGEVVNGQREGEWKWWHPNGEVMQIANYKNGKYEGERLIREKTDGQYQALVFKYSNGELQSERPTISD